MIPLNILASFLLFLLPFERVPAVDVAGITIRLSSIVILVFIISIPFFFRKQIFAKISAIDISIVVYYLITVLSITVATDKHRAVMVCALLLFTICGYALISRAYRQRLEAEKISQILIISGVVTALFGVFQFFGDSFGLSTSITELLPRYTKAVFGFPRIQSVGLEPLYYANFLLLPLLLVTQRLLDQVAKPSLKNILIFILLLSVFILTLSRGGYIALVVGLIILLIQHLRVRGMWRNAGILGACVIASLFIAYLAVTVVSGNKGTSTFQDQAVANSDQLRGASVNPRLDNYKEAFRLFKTKPILGVGMGNYGVVNRFPKDISKDGYQIVNNQYLETLAETGILGFLALASLGILVLVKLWKLVRGHKVQPLAIVLLATFLGIVVQYNFFSTIYFLFLWVVIGLIEALPLPQETI